MIPFTAPSKRVSESRVALITTAGVHLDDQPPFDRETQTGDCSFRRIPADADLSRVRIWWDHEQRQHANQDLNCALPLALLSDFCTIAPAHYSFSGAIPDPRPLIEESAPAVAAELRDACVDAVVIAPS